MAARLGDVLYWAGSTIALLLVAFGLGLAGIEKSSEAQLWILGIFGVLAVITWLLGRACRYVLAGR
jgi:hypothetical protein